MRRRRLAAGQCEHVKVDVKVDPGWHVNAAEAPDNVAPTTLTLDPACHAELAEVNYPPPEEIRLDSQSIRAYRGEFTIIANVRISDQASGDITLRMVLEVQPCSSCQCLQIQRHVLELLVTVKARRRNNR